MDLELQHREELLGQGSLAMKKLLHLYLLITLMARIGCQRGYNYCTMKYKREQKHSNTDSLQYKSPFVETV